MSEQPDVDRSVKRRTDRALVLALVASVLTGEPDLELLRAAQSTPQGVAGLADFVVHRLRCSDGEPLVELGRLTLVPTAPRSVALQLVAARLRGQATHRHILDVLAEPMGALQLAVLGAVLLGETGRDPVLVLNDYDEPRAGT